MKKKSVAILLVMSCLAVNLGACSGGKGGVDYELDSSQAKETQGQKGAGSTLAQFENEEDWVESFSVTRENGKEVDIQMDGEVQIPDVDHMSVMEVKAVEEQDLDFSVMEEMAYPGTKEIYDTRDEEYAAYKDFQTRIILLKTEEYALHVAEEKRGDLLRYFYWEDGWAESSGNICSLSQEQAKEKAVDFLERLGISMSNYQLEMQAGLLWSNEMYSSTPFMEDGYYFRYVLKDDLGNDLITSLEDYENIGRLCTGSCDELNVCIEISLVEEGVLDVRLENSVQVIGSTPVTKYASFETVKESVRTALKEDFDRVYIPRDPYYDTQENLIINSIEFQL